MAFSRKRLSAFLDLDSKCICCRGSLVELLEYTKYCILYIVFYVTVVTSLMTFLMNKFTSTVIPTYF